MKIQITLLLSAGLCISSNSMADDQYKKLNKLSIVDQSNFKSVADIQAELRELLETKQFKKIDRLVEGALKNQKLYYDGKPFHTIYFDALVRIAKGDQVKSINFYENNIELAKEWLKQEPQSAMAYNYYALALRAQAWNVRGGQYSHEVPEDRMKSFVDKIGQSLEFLIKNHDIASKDPSYYMILNYSLKEVGAINDSIQVYLEGIKKYPSYRIIYNEFMGQFQDKWSGYSVEAVGQIIKDIQEENPTKKDLYYYHILYTANNNNYKVTDFNVDWDRVENGAVETLALLPTLNRIDQVFTLYCSYPGNKNRMLKLSKAFKSGDLSKLNNERINYFIQNCPE